MPSLSQAVFEEPPGALQRRSLAPGYERMDLPEVSRTLALLACLCSQRSLLGCHVDSCTNACAEQLENSSCPAGSVPPHVQGLVAYVVEHPRHVPDALKRLRDSMQVCRAAGRWPEQSCRGRAVSAAVPGRHAVR
jgi:hypothetical protein